MICMIKAPKTAVAERRPSVNKSAAPKPAKVPRISIIVDDSRWRADKAVLDLIRRAVRLTLLGSAEVSPVTILLSNDKRLRELNAAFRGQDKPTNVLSFPGASGGEPYLGDVAIGYGVVSREARAQKKSLAAHAAHLAVHGVLHLLGFDHEKANEANRMEQQEIRLLARLGIADPYTAGGKAA
jgi:probable rRNA maturation factor